MVCRSYSNSHHFRHRRVRSVAEHTKKQFKRNAKHRPKPATKTRFNIQQLQLKQKIMNKEQSEQFGKELRKRKEWTDNELKKTEALIKIRPTSEEQNDFIITVGNHLATENHFETREEAEKFIRFPKWETILALIGEIIQFYESNNHKNKEK